MLQHITSEILWRHLTDGQIADPYVVRGIAEDVLGIDEDDLFIRAEIPDGVSFVLESLISDTRARIGGISEDGRLRAFRAVYPQVPDIEEWANNPVGSEGGVGICWADRFEGAIGYGSPQKGAVFILEATFEPECVDWPTTILVESYQKEGEFRLVSQAEVKIEAVYGSDRKIQHQTHGIKFLA